MKKIKGIIQTITSPIFIWIYENGIQVSETDTEYKLYLKNIYNLNTTRNLQSTRTIKIFLN
jgi:hypothetical protein